MLRNIWLHNINIASQAESLGHIGGFSTELELLVTYYSKRVPRFKTLEKMSGGNLFAIYLKVVLKSGFARRNNLKEDLRERTYAAMYIFMYVHTNMYIMYMYTCVVRAPG